MPTLPGASARPSELVSCPSSLSAGAWLPGTRTGPEAANASSLLETLMQSWTLPGAGGRQEQAAQHLSIRAQHAARLPRSCWGAARQGKV